MEDIREVRVYPADTVEEECGRLIGAVTHLFISDASKGYRVFIENMLKHEMRNLYCDRAQICGIYPPGDVSCIFYSIQS
ncbi:MAG: hypothetical protein K2P76_06240 [Lachnospiraceae bacterium]|nr:hypothetical protein [Lachnospiraceae bacterium]